MNLTQNGNVELLDFQLKNYISMTESNIQLLMKCNDPVVNMIAIYLKVDLARLKKDCGIETLNEII